MSTDYTYDEQGQFFPYFVLTITAIFTLPITYNVLKPSKALENTAPRIQSDFVPGQADLIEKQRRKLKRKELKLKRMVVAGVGWLVMAWMVYLMIVTARTIPKIWDPYDILGLSRSASEKEIKKHYKLLSLTMHPDKVKLNDAANETAQWASDRWVEVTKAFKALTDEDIRNNFIQYGHPDGKQGFSIGIALPQFIVTEGNGKYVLLLYAGFLGVLLPYLVGRWWYGTQNVTREKILVGSASNLFREYEEDMNPHSVIGALSGGDEFKDAYGDASGSGKVEKAITAENDERPKGIVPAQARKKLLGLDDDERRKALALLWAYLSRVDLKDPTLDEQKYEAAPIACSLNEAFASMMLAFGNIEPLLSSYLTTQCIIQAILPGDSPLLQLPHFTPKIVRLLQEEALQQNHSVQSFMDLPDPQRRKLLVTSGLLQESEYKTAVKAASQMPYAKVEKAFFKVIGEKSITPGSLIQFVVKVRIIPPGTQNVPPVNELDLEDVDPREGDLDALHGKSKKVKDETGKIITLPADEPVQPALAHAPYYPRDHSPKWRIFLGENRSGKIAVPPFTFSTFDKPVFNEDGTPTCNVQTLKMQFGAPPQVGQYPFTAYLICDSYVGFDSQIGVTMVVEEASQAVEIEEEDEISEPEEDTLAGQMNALKTGQAPKRSKKVDHDDSSDGSDTEGEQESESSTDTDTDTDDDDD